MALPSQGHHQLTTGAGANPPAGRKRFVIDMPNLAAGTMPADEFDHRYVAQPWLAYLHIVPDALYLLSAPLQLADTGFAAVTTPSIDGSVGCSPVRR
jgi:hypothetical protein